MKHLNTARSASLKIKSFDVVNDSIGLVIFKISLSYDLIPDETQLAMDYDLKR